MKTDKGKKQKTQPCRKSAADPYLIHNHRAKLINEAEELRTLAEIFYLAGNEVRLKILYLLFQEEQLSVCDITNILEMKIPAVSQHLRKLKDLGVVKTRRRGQTIYYSLHEDYHYYLDVFFNRLLKYKP
jgi:DNA-binding transcriptional ArsR family regulator